MVLQGVVVFKIDGSDWTLDLRPDSTPSVAEGPPPADAKPDLTLTISDDNFAKLVAGKLGPQQVRLHGQQVARHSSACVSFGAHSTAFGLVAPLARSGFNCKLAKQRDRY